MKELQVFTNPEFGQVRTVTIEEEPWFVGKDVAVALGYEQPRDAVYRLVDPEDKGVGEIQTPSGKQKMTIINESGLYGLIFGSKLESAKRFKHWVTHDVLPAIRKTGTYSVNPKARALTTDDYMKAAQLAATCRNERLPYVLGFLEQAGFNIPEVTTPPPADDGPIDCTMIQKLMDAAGVTQDELSRRTNISLDSIDAFNLGDTFEGIYNNTSETAANTAASADSLNLNNEELEWMRDLAEQEAINRFTTTEIRVDMGGVTQNVASYLDAETLTHRMVEAINNGAAMGVEGVYA